MPGFVALSDPANRAIDPDNPLPVQLATGEVGGVDVHGHRVSETDRSGVIAAGGNAQPLMGANTNRRGFSVQNLSTGDLMLNSVGAASATAGVRVGPNMLYEAPFWAVPTTEISVWGATTAQRFTAREW